MRDACAGCFKTVGTPARLKIFMAVRDKKVDISALARLTGLRQPTVTFHVNELAKAGLVKKIKSGRNVFCVSSPPVCPHCPLFN